MAGAQYGTDILSNTELGGDMTVDLENLIDRSNYLNIEEAKKHPRFEMKTVRTWEYDELWIVSQTGMTLFALNVDCTEAYTLVAGKRARLCVQAYLDEKEDLERESEELIRKRREKKRRKKEGLPPLEEEPAKKKEEKTYDWKFAHISAFFDDDTRQLVITHDEGKLQVHPCSREDDRLSGTPPLQRKQERTYASSRTQNGRTRSTDQMRKSGKMMPQSTKRTRSLSTPKWWNRRRASERTNDPYEIKNERNFHIRSFRTACHENHFLTNR